MAAQRLAWVLTLSRQDPSRGSATRVLGLVSIRRSADFVQRHLESLALLVRFSLADQLAASRYNKPANLLERYLGSVVDITIAAGDFVFRAQLSDVVALHVVDGREELEWVGRPVRRSMDSPAWQPPRMRAAKIDFYVPGLLPDLIVDAHSIIVGD